MLGGKLDGSCPICTRGTSSDPKEEGAEAGRREAQTKIAEANARFFRTIAAARRDAGLPPLFWMEPDYDKEAGIAWSSLSLWYRAMQIGWWVYDRKEKSWFFADASKAAAAFVDGSRVFYGKRSDIVDEVKKSG